MPYRNATSSYFSLQVTCENLLYDFWMPGGWYWPDHEMSRGWCIFLKMLGSGLWGQKSCRVFVWRHCDNVPITYIADAMLEKFLQDSSLFNISEEIALTSQLLHITYFLKNQCKSECRFQLANLHWITNTVSSKLNCITKIKYEIKNFEVCKWTDQHQKWPR